MHRSIGQRYAAWPIWEIDTCLLRHRCSFRSCGIAEFDRIGPSDWRRREGCRRSDRCAVLHGPRHRAHRQATHFSRYQGARRKIGEKRMELAQLGRIAGDRSAFTRRDFVDHDQPDSDPRARPSEHPLQPDIEPQRSLVLCLGKARSIETIWHGRDNPAATNASSECASEMAQCCTTVAAAFLATRKGRVHQEDRGDWAAMQVGNKFAIVGADCGLRKDVCQAAASASIDLV